MSKFSREAHKLSRRLAEISCATLQNKQILVKSVNGLNRGLVKPPFCRWVGACDEKFPKKIVYYTRAKRRWYQLCRSPQGCNQQTATPMYYEV